eukprot:maker-scaffold995_size72343-snap-gene-0.17 protein:Tk07624 transcript:maker-scaffold995_size72343-snap-gene-0.17-mRNA-1 annotation:"protein smg7"
MTTDEDDGPTNNREIQLSVPQLFHKAEEIRSFFSKKRNVFFDGSLWTDHQELLNLYKTILLRDLNYALDKKVEVDLWNVCFRDYIAFLQNAGRERGNFQKLKAAETHQVLIWFTHLGSGFFTVLLEELRPLLAADLPNLRTGCELHPSSAFEVQPKLAKADLQSHVYLLQYCLIHLGDLARYRKELWDAEHFYRQAIQMAPNSGQGYNQVALLLGNRGDTLASAFYYVRALALKHPFTVAASNIGKLLSQLKEALPYKDVNVNSQSFPTYVLKFHSYLHSAVHLKTAAKYCHLLNASLTCLIATESMKWDDTFKVLVINIFFIHEALEGKDDGTTKTKDEQKVLELLLELQAGMFNDFLLPVYTLTDGDALLNYCALPAIKILLQWICVCPEALESKAFLKRLQIWPSLCRMLNQLTSLTAKSVTDLESLGSVPLPEDFDLQCFTPLQGAQKGLNFKKYTRQDKQISQVKLLELRAFRILKLGQCLASSEYVGRKVILCKSSEDSEDSETSSFEAIEQKIPLDLLKGLDSKNLESSSEEDEPINSIGNHRTNNLSDQLAPAEVVETAIPQVKRPLHRKNVAIEALLRQKQAQVSVQRPVGHSMGTSSQGPPSIPPLIPNPDLGPRAMPSKGPDFSMPPPVVANHLSTRPRAVPERPMSLLAIRPDQGLPWGVSHSNLPVPRPQLPGNTLGYGPSFNLPQNFGRLPVNPSLLNRPRQDSRSSLLQLIGNSPNGSQAPSHTAPSLGPTYSLFAGPSWNGGAQSFLEAVPAPGSRNPLPIVPSPLESLILQQQQEQRNARADY